MKGTLEATDRPSEARPDERIVAEFVFDERRYRIVLTGRQSSSDVGPAGNQFELGGQVLAVVDSSANDEHKRCTDVSELLTARELQIATLIAIGRPNKQIASQLRISEWTVAAHLRRIFAKLGVRSRAAMAFRCAALVDDDRRVGSRSSVRVHSSFR